LFRAFWLTGLAGALCAAAALGADEGAAPTAAPAARPAPGKPDLPEGWRLLYSQAFDQEAALGDFEFSDPKQWRWTPRDGDGCLEALPKGTYRPKLRSPFVIALLRDRVFRDFILEADLLQTSKEYGHRDMCLFFGFEAVARYYYAHLGTRHDTASHNVMIVNEAPRKAVTAKATAGVNWGKDVWHRVRIVRKTAPGTVEVYFDDMAQPAITAEDKTFLAGRVGAGTFDDCGLVDNLRIWGPAVEEAKTADVFRPAAHGEKKP
jgi:hypothetical protein